MATEEYLLTCCKGRRDRNDGTYTKYFSLCECPNQWWASIQTSPAATCSTFQETEVRLWGWSEPCWDVNDGTPALMWDTRTTTFSGIVVEIFSSCGEGDIARVQNKYTGSRVETYDLDGNYTKVSDSLLHEQRTRQVRSVDDECETEEWTEWVVKSNPYHTASQCNYVSHTSTSVDIMNVLGSALGTVVGSMTYSGAVTEQSAEAHQLKIIDCNLYQSKSGGIKSAYEIYAINSYKYEKQTYCMVFERLTAGSEYEYSFNVYYAGSYPWPSPLISPLVYTHTVTGTFTATDVFHVVGGTGVEDPTQSGAGRVKDVVPQTDMPFIRGESYEYKELAIELKQPT